MLLRDEIPSVSRRAAGVLLDFLMLELAMIPVVLALREVTASPTLMRGIELTIAIVYSTVFLGGRGQTPGKIMTSVRVISADGMALNQRQAIVRSLLKWAPIFVPLMLAALFVPVPTTLQDASMDSPLPLPEPDPMTTLIPFIGLILLLVIAWRMKRHPDGRAWHDLAAETSVVKVQ